MITKYTKDGRLKTYRCDRYGFWRPVALMNKLQGLATTHAEILGAGPRYCASKNIAWVLTHMFVDVIDMPRVEEELVYSTWPASSGPVRSERDFEIKDKNGKLRVRAISQWVLIDLHTRRPVRLSDYFPNWECVPERVWDREFDKGPDFIPTKSCVMACRFDDIDINQHVNNAVYTTWATESVGFDYRNSHKLRGIDLYFEHEIMPNAATVRVEVAFDGNTTRHKIMTNEVEHAKVICYWADR